MNKEQAYKEALGRLPLILRFPIPFITWFMPRYDLKGMFMEGINYQLGNEIKKLKSK